MYLKRGPALMTSTRKGGRGGPEICHLFPILVSKHLMYLYLMLNFADKVGRGFVDAINV